MFTLTETETACGVTTQPIALIEYPRISSTCANRPDIWEWRLDHAIIAGHLS